MLGDGKQTRDFTYVGDVVTGRARRCEAPNVAGEVINVAGRRPRSASSTSCGRSSASSRRDIEPTFGPARDGDVRDSQADITKREACWASTPSVSLEEGLRRTVAWYQTSQAKHVG